MNLSPKQKAFFLIVLHQRTQDAEALFSLLPEAEKNEMLKLYQELKKHNDKEIKHVAVSEFFKLARLKNQTYLSELHVDWLVDYLLQESTDIVAAILRQFPAELVNAILDRLPEEFLNQMPKMGHTFAIPSGLVELLQQKMESQFQLKKSYEKGQTFEFEHLCILPAAKIERVFYHLGYHEIALGLSTLPATATQVILERLSPQDRRQVEKVMTKTSRVSESRLKRAQVHLIHKDIHTSHSTQFVKGLGYLLFSKMVLHRDQADLTVIKKKMSKEDAALLEDFVLAQLEKNTEATVLAYREDLLYAVQNVLAEA